MVVKSQIKLIKSLHQKKYRIRYGMFVVEGIKAVTELLDSHFKVYKVYAAEVGELKGKTDFLEIITENEIKQMSSLKNPGKILAVFYIAKPRPVDFKDWVVALDDVRDPGNLGTIIRLCDWFGIRHLICSSNTVDCFNPKVLQATMGSISRVNILYTELSEFLSNSELPVYGAFMNGETVYNTTAPRRGVLVLGNEANGISKEVEALVNVKICIPQFGERTAESLNVATASAILLSELRRR
ncbi:MAG: RNA methyltransferase [Flavobacteriaceae bacterium]